MKISSSDQKILQKKKCILHNLNVKNPEVEYTSFLTQPFAQVVLKPQFFIPLVRVIILENFIEKFYPKIGEIKLVY